MNLNDVTVQPSKRAESSKNDITQSINSEHFTFVSIKNVKNNVTKTNCVLTLHYRVNFKLVSKYRR